MAWTDLAYNQMVSFTDAQSGGFRLLSGQSVDSNQCMTKSEALEKYNLIASNMDFFTDSQLVPKFTWISSCINCTELVGGVIIGSQSWDKCNLNVTTYSDGEPILHVTSSTDWPNTMIGAWCHYDNDPANDAIYGKLYNWYAVAGIWNEESLTNPSARKSLAPVGKSIPTYADWEILINELGGFTVAGARMKEEGTCHWEVDLGNLATNDSGFTALGAGARYGNPAEFTLINQVGAYWSATTELVSENYFPYLAYLDTSSSVQLTGVYADFGLSVRCLATPTIAPFWELIIEVTNPGDKFGFFIGSATSPNINIDWGDNNNNNFTTPSQFVENTYSTPGTYSVKTSGSFLGSTNLGNIRIALSSDTDNTFNNGTNTAARMVLSTSKISGISGLTSLNNLFDGCSNLESVPSDLFSDVTTVTSFLYVFRGCTSLDNIPGDLFANNVDAKNLSGLFNYCTSLTSIPENLFANNATASSFSQTFEFCTSLTSIPPLLFDNILIISSLTTGGLYSTFRRCTSLTSIPPLLFAKLTVTNFYNTFEFCTSLTDISENLFANNTNTIRFDLVFANCTSLDNIPENLFANNVNVTNFDKVFLNCTSLTSIPENLFANNLATIQFFQVFQGCTSLTSIPSLLFANNPNVENFQYAFSQCNSLTSIPEDLFANNPNVANFGNAFSQCNSLTSIPEDLFANNPNVTSFVGIFNRTGLTSIPENLFANNPNVTSFGNTFDQCGSLTSIPPLLFANNPNVTSFTNVFASCTSLTSIPAGLFATNSKVNNFYAAFEECAFLTTVPSNLFVQLSSTSINFRYVFYKCPRLTQVFDMFGPPSSYSTRFLNKQVDFRNAFDRTNTSAIAHPPLLGTAPELWNFDYGSATPQTADCWQGWTSYSNYISNYSSIPTTWL